MSKGDLSLGPAGSEVLLSPFGRTLSVREIETAREERTIDGTFKKDVMYVKHEFTVSYNIITGDSLTAILDIYHNNSQPLSFIIDHGASQSTYTVYMKPVNRTRVLLQDDGLWSGVTIELVQA